MKEMEELKELLFSTEDSAYSRLILNDLEAAVSKLEKAKEILTEFKTLEGDMFEELKILHIQFTHYFALYEKQSQYVEIENMMYQILLDSGYEEVAV